VGVQRSGFTNSTIEMWVAREGEPSVKTHFKTGVVLRRKDGAIDTDEKYGKFWITMFHTAKDPSDVHPDYEVWYDEVIVSKSRIPDPGVKVSDFQPSITFTGSPGSVAQDGSATLQWSTQNVDSCTASGGWDGSQNTAGTMEVGPIAQTTTYTLTCSGPGGSTSESVTVTVDSGNPIPEIQFSTDASNVNVDSFATLMWNTNADSCVASGNWSGSKNAVGSESVGPIQSNSTYVLTCENQNGQNSKAVNITVNSGTTTPADDPDGSGGGAINILLMVCLLLLWSGALVSRALLSRRPYH
jgi:hypothetical protein